MTALTAQKESGCDWDFRILPTDLDTSMLKKAKAGVYSRDCLESVPATMRERLLRQTGREPENVLLAKVAQEQVKFPATHSPRPLADGRKIRCDLCRNVMIFFDAKTKAILIDRFHGQLADGGWLYVGHSESLLDHQTRFKLRGRTIYEKIS